MNNSDFRSSSKTTLTLEHRTLASAHRSTICCVNIIQTLLTEKMIERIKSAKYIRNYTGRL